MKRICARYALTALALSVLLSGCATGHSKPGDLNKVTLPIVVEYDRDIMLSAAEEMKACPSLSVLAVDYGQMRDEVRVLLGDKVDVTR